MNDPSSDSVSNPKPPDLRPGQQLPPLWWTYFALTGGAMLMSVYFTSIHYTGMYVGTLLTMYFAFYWAMITVKGEVPRPPFAFIGQLLEILQGYLRRKKGPPKGGGAVPSEEPARTKGRVKKPARKKETAVVE